MTRRKLVVEVDRHGVHVRVDRYDPTPRWQVLNFERRTEKVLAEQSERCGAMTATLQAIAAGSVVNPAGVAAEALRTYGMPIYQDAAGAQF